MHDVEVQGWQAGTLSDYPRDYVCRLYTEQSVCDPVFLRDQQVFVNRRTTPSVVLLACWCS